MRSLFTLCLLLLFSASSLLASADDVDDYIKAQMSLRHIPGLSLAVVKAGKIIKVKGYGQANIETNTPAAPETVYKIASISKQFLAAGVMLLVSEGKLDLEEKAGKFLEGSPSSWKDITIRHLLSHTSGLVEDPPGFEPYKMQSDAEIVQKAYATPLLFAPGEKWSYSNLGYFVLAEILHKVSGMAWNDFLAKRLFQPAGMAATRLTTTAGIVPHRADGYEWNHDQQENAENWIAVRPSGAYLSTVLDMAKWDAILSSDTLLSPTLREQMWRPVKLNSGASYPYGMGWFLEPWQGHPRISHRGGLPGFNSDFEHFTDDKLTVIVMLNTTSADPQNIALHVAGFYIPALAPPLEPAIPDTEPQITLKFKKLLSGLIAGNPDMRLFSAETAARLTEKLKAQAADTLRMPGSLRSITLVEQKNQGDRRLYRYRLNYRNFHLIVQCGFNKDGEIIGFGIPPESGIQN